MESGLRALDLFCRSALGGVEPWLWKFLLLLNSEVQTFWVVSPPPGLLNHSSASELNPLPHCSMGTRRACPPGPESGRGLVGGLQLGCPTGAWVEGQGTSLGAQRPQFGFRLRCPRPTHGLSELHSEPPLLGPCDTLRDLSMGKSTETVSHDELLKQLETLSWRTAGLGVRASLADL